MHTGGEWSGDLLIADWDDLAKIIASSLHVTTLKSHEAQVTTAQFFYKQNKNADGTLKQEGPVVPRPPRHRQHEKEDDAAGGDSDADNTLP